VRERLSHQLPSANVTVNTIAGSLLIQDKTIDPDLIAEFAESEKLFRLVDFRDHRESLFRVVADPVGKLNDSLSRISGGSMDLQAVTFILLFGTGLYQLLRGNFRAPPWYVAFWYAFLLFTKSISDKADANTSSPAEAVSKSDPL
jgi:hypothetical protein